jgi:3-hydroxyacyl-CoA dehydrogenase
MLRPLFVSCRSLHSIKALTYGGHRSYASSATDVTRITLIGGGTIGASLAALHLEKALDFKPVKLVIYDNKQGLKEYLRKSIPLYMQHTFKSKTQDTPALSKATDFFEACMRDGTIRIDDDLASAVSMADIVEEQGPEVLEFKKDIWPKIEQYAPSNALLWSSTSGIPASLQNKGMKDPSRLLIVHPFNPPHLMPMLEVVPSDVTAKTVIERTIKYWKSIGMTPTVLKKEAQGFIANRLAFALFREALNIVSSGIATPKDVDRIVTGSMGPRWAIAGPFESYNAGGGPGGIEQFLEKLGGTIQACWDDQGSVNFGDGWEKQVCEETKEAYGVADLSKRDALTRNVLNAALGKATEEAK